MLVLGIFFGRLCSCLIGVVTGFLALLVPGFSSHVEGTFYLHTHTANDTHQC